MNTLKRALKKHIEKNTIKYVIAFSLFMAGIAAGVICVISNMPDIPKSVEESIINMGELISSNGYNYANVMKNSIFKNIRSLGIIYIGGLSLWLVPLSLMVLAVVGFSYGFTTAYFSYTFGAGGLWVSITSLIVNIAITIPVYMILTVISFNNAISRHLKKDRPNMAAYTLYFCIMLVLLIPVVLCDTFLIPEIIKCFCGDFS